MVILTIRTDKPEAEIGLFNIKEEIDYIKWQAHRELSNTIHVQIEKILNKSSISWNDIGGVVCFKGPGSFTGLRIGLTVANALAYANQVPIVARRGENWLEKGIADLQTGKNDKIATPYYDRPATTSAHKL